jgi:sugar lactone lactonase YvrE
MHLSRRTALGAATAAARLQGAATACARGGDANSDSARAAGAAAGTSGVPANAGTDSAQRMNAAAGGAAGGTGAAYTRSATITGGFKTPESVKYDADLDVYFVSNINGNPSQKDGNGFISRIRADNTIDSLGFIRGGRNGVTLNAPKGMAIVGDTLVVTDIDAVRMFNKRTGAPIASVDLTSQKATFLNDVAVGGDGALYITDTGIRFSQTGEMTHPGTDQIFKIAGRKATVAASGAGLSGPNGITWDRGNGRFLVAPFGGSALVMWKPNDSAPPSPMATAGAGQFDGVEVLDGGRVLASSWADSSVTLFQGTTATRVATGVPSPADIGVDTKHNKLLVPIFTGDRIEVFDIR